MSYHYDRNKKNKYQRYVLFIILFVLVFFTPFFHMIFDLVEKPLARVWENNGETLRGSENIFQAFYGKTQIIKENKYLKNEIEILRVDNLRTEYLSAELQKLGYSNRDPDIFAAASILSFGGFGYYDTMIINKGEIDGLSVGDKVFSGDVLLGLLLDVYDTTARVSLYSKSGELNQGFLFPYNINVVSYGFGKGSFRIELARDVPAKAGDILYSLDEPGAIVAVVREVLFDPRDPFKQVFLSYPVNINSLHSVEVKKEK